MRTGDGSCPQPLRLFLLRTYGIVAAEQRCHASAEMISLASRLTVEAMAC